MGYRLEFYPGKSRLQLSGSFGSIEEEEQLLTTKGVIRRIALEYLINAEIFPVRVRALGVSVVMGFHFLNQYGNSRALPPMLQAMDEWGAFLFFAAECVLSIIFVWMFLPETSGRSLEEMDELFNKPFWKIGGGAKAVPRRDEEGGREAVADERETTEVNVGTLRRYDAQSPAVEEEDAMKERYKEKDDGLRLRTE